LENISGNNRHCVVLSSDTRKPFFALQTLTEQHVCSRRELPRPLFYEFFGLRVSASQQFQAKGFYMSGCVSLVLAVLKLTEMKQWSWWRVFLPLWVIVGHNVIYVLVGFLCLFAVRYGEDEEAEEPAKVQSNRLVYQVASLVCVLISTDNLLRWLERGGNSYWFWLCSGSVAMVVLFGILALVAQFFYWAEIVEELNDRLVEGSGYRDID